MPSLNTLAVYLPVAFVMAFTPGPATLFVLGRATTHGRQGGLVSAAGLLSGTLVLIGLAAIGLTGVLEASPAVFDVLKAAGAAYLVYLGVRTWTVGGDTAAPEAAHGGKRTGWRLYRDGVVTELLNPKAALFYASVLPQFVDLRRADVPQQIMALGVVFCIIASISLWLIAMSAGSVGARIARYPGWLKAARRISGLVLVALGVRLAASRAW